MDECRGTEADISTGEAHYFSRARQVLWHKGATSGLVQKVVEARIDDDQDAIWLRVDVAGSGASCHVGYRSCFYRSLPVGEDAGQPLSFAEQRKTFESEEVYGDAPTQHNCSPCWLRCILDPVVGSV
ncbi:phosphoribosyl-AMP cyclohydrolase [Ruegeria sp. Ofav3-42]|uniref:phosphoribosyl-AMP cyclohydrolase n=1 Tax=Ruegeria sp. Ofav3-42 TaxID=2917759 RepID=UPI00351D7A60